MATVNITINGQVITAQAGQTVLDAATQVGIDVPVLCNHPALKMWGGCRICLVEVAKQRTLQPACAFPVSEGMEVWTESEKVVNARKFVLQLLFSERNHYCMFCEMDGDCELQAMAYRYGLDHWVYTRPAQRLPVDATRRYFFLDHNRCILCRRCVRACSDIAANHTLGLRQRGANSMIMADHNVPFGESSCVECGTCLQVCPTGALVDRNSAYGGREKDVVHSQTTCIQCSVGCALDVVTRHRRLLRVDGVWDVAPSKGLLCVIGRFDPLYEERLRITRPMLRRNGSLAEVEWDEALTVVADQLRKGAAGLAASVTSNEALDAFASLMQKTGGTAAVIDPKLPDLGNVKNGTLLDILEADLILLVGCDPLVDHRVVGYLIKRIFERGSRLVTVGDGVGELKDYATDAVSDSQVQRAVELAQAAHNAVVVYGTGLSDSAREALVSLADKACFVGLVPGANARGAEAAGISRVGWADAKTRYLLLGEAKGVEKRVSLSNGEFTIVQASYFSPLVESADVVLPSPIWAERSGHTTNLEGKVLPLKPAIDMPADVRDDAEVLKTLVEMV